MSLVREDPELARNVESIDDLIGFFRAGETPVEDNRVGTEHEKIGLNAQDLSPVPFEGERGIEAFLAALERDHDFAPLHDGGRLVGLERDGASITLEPGGQLELSGAPLATMHETCREFQEHLALIKHVSERFGFVWLGLGIHPFAAEEDVPRMPRERHELMRSYLSQRGTRALEMMHATCTVQANFDYADEADAGRKLRMATAAAPVVTALWANSSISAGRPNGFESRRAWIWRDTDTDRCGLLPFVFAEDFEQSPYTSYTEWALDVPLFFVVRDGKHLPAGGLTFREFHERGFGEHRATLADWNVHLTTLFPEVRLKKVIEVRSADAVPPGLVCALPALWKGLLYDETALAAATDLLRSWSHLEVDALHTQVALRGLSARTPDGPVLEVARALVELSAQGLTRLDARNRVGEDESLFIDPLFEILERGTSPGRALLERWDGPWQRRTEPLVEYARY